MTVTKKQFLPALHKSDNLKSPDFPSVEDKNYTSTILKYSNLALPFPQLDTDAKTIVAAINELYHTKSTVIPNPPGEEPTDTLNTVKIDGTVFNIEGGGGGTGVSGYDIKHYVGTNSDKITQDWDVEEINTFINKDSTNYQAIEFPLCVTDQFKFKNDTDVKIDTELNLDIYIPWALVLSSQGEPFKDINFGYELRQYVVDENNQETRIADYAPQEFLFEDAVQFHNDYSAIGATQYSLEDRTIAGYNIREYFGEFGFYGGVTARGRRQGGEIIEWDYYRGVNDALIWTYYFYKTPYSEYDYYDTKHYSYWRSADYYGRPESDTSRAIPAKRFELFRLNDGDEGKGIIAHDPVIYKLDVQIPVSWHLVDNGYNEPNHKPITCYYQLYFQYSDDDGRTWFDLALGDYYGDYPTYMWEWKGTPENPEPEKRETISFTWFIDKYHLPIDDTNGFILRGDILVSAVPQDTYDANNFPCELHFGILPDAYVTFTVVDAIDYNKEPDSEISVATQTFTTEAPDENGESVTICEFTDLPVGRICGLTVNCNPETGIYIGYKYISKNTYAVYCQDFVPEGTTIEIVILYYADDSSSSESGSSESVSGASSLPEDTFPAHLTTTISRDFYKLLQKSNQYILPNNNYRIKTTLAITTGGQSIRDVYAVIRPSKATTIVEGYDEIRNGGGGGGESYTAGDGIYLLKSNTTSINADAGRFSGMYHSAYYRSEYDSTMRENDWKPVSGMYAVYDEFHPDTLQDTFVLSRTPILTAIALIYHPNGQIGDTSYTLTGRTAKLDSKANPYTTVRIYYTTSEAESGLPVYQTLGHTYDKNSGPSTCSIHCEGYEKLRVFITQDIEECEGGRFNDHEYVVISAPNISVIQDADLGDRDYCEFNGKGKKLTNYYMTDFDRFNTFRGGYENVTIEYRKDEGIVNTHRAYMFYFLEEFYGDVHQASVTGDGVTDTFNIGSPGRLGNILNVYHSYNHYEQAIDLSHISVIDHTSIKFDYIIPSGESVYIRYTTYPSEGEIFNDYSTNYAISKHAHSEGANTKALGNYSHTEGYGTYANAYSHAEGNGSKALSDNTSHAEGMNTVAAGAYSHAEGNEAKALGADSHAEGLKTLAYGLGSHAEGHGTKAYGDRAHAEGRDSIASSDYAHAEGRGTSASGSDGAHAEGYQSNASGYASHAEGGNTIASGWTSHAEGYHSEAREHSTHTQGDYTIATGRASHVFGKYNIEDTNEGDYNGYRKYVEIVGNGNSSGGVTTRSNARTLDWDGNEYVAGTITVGVGPRSGMDVATKKYVDDHSGGGGGIPSIKVGTGIAAELFNQEDDYNESTASGDYSHAEGISTTASNDGAHAEGRNSEASGKYSHAEGSNTVASAYYAHAEGNSTEASGGDGAHAEGNDTVASGSSAHAEGTHTQATGAGSHAGGGYSIASGQYSYAMGDNTRASGDYSHAEGQTTIATGDRSHAEGYDTTASGNSAHAEGYGTIASNSYAHAEGQSSVASNAVAHAEGYGSTASGYVSHAEGYQTQARATGTHTEGYQTQATQNFAHAEGAYNIASGFESHAEGIHTFATGDFSHSEGRGLEDAPNVAAGDGSHVEGFQSQAIGNASHAEGGGTRAIGQESHAEGAGTWAYGKWSHAEGAGTSVYANYSHVEGAGVDVIKEYSHAEGAGNKCIGQYNHIEGGGNVSTNHMSHTEGAGNTNDGVQAHAEGSGNGLSGEEAHVEGAGNKIHAPKSHGEGGGNSLYGLGSHVEGKHNEVAGFAVHAEGGWNFVGTNTPITQFSQTTSYNVGDVVGPNSVYVNFSDFTEQIVSQYLYRCITAPGQIQSGNGVEFITPVTWNSSTAYTTGTVVLYTTNIGIPLYYYANKDISAGVIPPISDSVGEGWQRIESILSPFKTTTSSGYYLLNADRMSSNVVAKVANGTTVQAMWEPIPAPKYTHVEGYRNIALGDYQHVGGKYNIADANKAVIIGNGVNNDGVIERSNAYTLDWNGNATFAGDITLGTTLSTSSQSIAAAINELYLNLGSEVSVSQIQHSGTKIAEITVDGTTTDIYSPNGGGGSTVVVEPVVQSGVNIADITVDGTTSRLYTPNAVSSVSVTQTQQSGTKIAEIDVDGTSTDLYAPTPTSVSVDDTLLTGTKVATITVDGVDTEILVPDAGDSVTVTQITSTGTHIADIEVDGITTELYAPNGGGGAVIDDTVIALDKTWSSSKINSELTSLADRIEAIERYLWGIPLITESGDQRITEDGSERILEQEE